MYRISAFRASDILTALCIYLMGETYFLDSFYPPFR